MYWNHRLMERVDDAGTSYEETNYYIVEVYYDETDNSIIGWTEKEAVWGESPDAVKQTLDWMKDALDKPVLNEADLLAQAKELEASGKGSIEERFGPFESFDLDELLAHLEEEDPGITERVKQMSDKLKEAYPDRLDQE